MNRNENPGPNVQQSHGMSSKSSGRTSHSGLCVTVIATTKEGTTAALDEAKRLAKDLDAHITVLKLEVVPFQFPLEKPPVSLDFTTRQQCSLVLQSSSRDEDVTIRTCLCRDRDACLKRIFRRRALVVIGGSRHWWKSHEERLEILLRGLGHHVIFIDVSGRNDSPNDGSFPVFRRSWRGGFHKPIAGAQTTFGNEELR
jgi:hypothetical protein